MIYLYALSEPTVSLIGFTGLQDAPLQLLERDGVAAVYSEHSQIEFRPEPETLWRHEAVVEQVRECGTVLPARFATTFPDAEALSCALTPAAPRLRTQLARVRGCVELAVRVGVGSRTETSEDPERDGGRDYLRAKLARHQERESLAERTLVPLSRFAAGTRRHRDPAGGATLTASYLVREPDVDRFAEEVRLLQRENDELMLSCTGPWAPYSFAAGEDT